MEKIYTVFISSTYEDLKDYRQAAIQSVLRLGHLPIVMENFNSSPYEPKKLISLYLEKTDYLVLIVGDCYGTILEDQGISYTEYEYFEAKKMGIPTLVFFADRKLLLPNDEDIALKLGFDDKNAGLKNEKLTEFKKKLMTTRSYFKSPEDLKILVSSSLSVSKDEFNRPGFTRGNIEKKENKKSEYIIKINLIKKNMSNEEYEDVHDKLFALNRYLFPASKSTPIRPISIRSDEYLISFFFIIKADTLFFAQTRKSQFEDLVKDKVYFHSCDLEIFKGFSKIK